MKVSMKLWEVPVNILSMVESRESECAVFELQPKPVISHFNSVTGSVTL